MTAEEYFHFPGKPERSELVRGVIIPMNQPGFRHGEICGQAYFLLRLFLNEHDVGRVLSNDSGVVTQREPDTVRGSDVSVYTYERVRRGESPIGYPQAAPNVVFEVRSPTDRWSEIHEKIAEYLSAGVEQVCVLIPETEEAHLFYPDRPVEILQGEDRLSLPAPLDEFDESVSAFFAT